MATENKGSGCGWVIVLGIFGPILLGQAFGGDLGFAIGGAIVVFGIWALLTVATGFLK